MSCKKSELVDAINSYASARLSNDKILIGFSVNLIGSLLETITFEPEEENEEEFEETEEEVEVA